MAAQTNGGARHAVGLVMAGILALVAATCGRSGDAHERVDGESPAVSAATWQGAGPYLACPLESASKAPSAPTTRPGTGGWFDDAAPHLEAQVPRTMGYTEGIDEPTAGLAERAEALSKALPAGFAVAGVETTQEAFCIGPTVSVMRWDLARFTNVDTAESVWIRWTTLLRKVNPLPDFVVERDSLQPHTELDGSTWVAYDLDGSGVIRHLWLVDRVGHLVKVSVWGAGSQRYAGWPTTAYWPDLPAATPSSIGLSAQLELAHVALHGR